MLDTTVFFQGTFHCRKQVHVSIHNSTKGDNHVLSYTQHYLCYEGFTRYYHYRDYFSWNTKKIT